MEFDLVIEDEHDVHVQVFDTFNEKYGWNSTSSKTNNIFKNMNTNNYMNDTHNNNISKYVNALNLFSLKKKTKVHTFGFNWLKLGMTNLSQ